MSTVETRRITELVTHLVQKANYEIPEDIMSALKDAALKEESGLGRDILDQIVKNLRMAAQEKSPMCQDTGLTVVFVEAGQDVTFIGGDLTEAIHEGVRRGSRDGFLRNSVVEEPLFHRKNTGVNAPAVIHYAVVPGTRVRLIVAPKGAGSENVSVARVLKPSDGTAGVKEFVITQVKERGQAACPPLIAGIGIGGTLEKAALLARRALLRPLTAANPDRETAALEDDLLKEINNLGIGPMGLGGRTTALKVSIETYPCHIASLPVAVNLSCYANRHAETEI